jgi:hypothetical protein
LSLSFQQLGWGCLKGSAEQKKGVQSRHPFSGLNLADRLAAESGELGKTILREPKSFSVLHKSVNRPPDVPPDFLGIHFLHLTRGEFRDISSPFVDLFN